MGPVLPCTVLFCNER